VAPPQTTLARLDTWRDTIRRMARISEITVAETAPAQSLQLIVRGETAALPLAGIIDIAAETERLTKERTKLDGETAKIDAKLGNADFLARAPEEVVDEQRERREAALARRAKIDEALGRLRAGV
jgi:valyl-tRNA synthetase